MGCPDGFVQAASGSVVHNADIVQALGYVKVVDEAVHRPGPDVTSAPHRDDLVLNQLEVPGGAGLGLRDPERWELGRILNQEVWLTVPYFPGAVLRPVPEERGGP